MKYLRTALAALALLLLLFSADAFANGTSFWTQAGVPQFYKGKFDGAALTDDGRIVLGTKIDKLFSTTEPYLWDVTYDAKGALWAGSSNKAILYRIDTKTGDAFEAAVLPGAGISALAADKHNNIYAAVFPGGAIYVKKPGAKAVLFSQAPANYIWDMAFGGGGDLYCVTGSPAGAFKISPDGMNMRILYISQSEKNFLSLFLEGDKYLYTGSSPNGLVIRVNIQEALKESGGMAVTAPPSAAPVSGDDIANFAEPVDTGTEIAPDTAGEPTDDAGDAAMGEESIAPAPPAAPEPDVKPDPRATVIVDLEEDEAYRLLPWKDGKFIVAANSLQAPPQPAQQKKPPSRPEPLSFPITQALQPNQYLVPARAYLVDQAGQTKKILEIPDPYILTMHRIDDAHVLIGTGNNGRIYNMNVEEDTAILQELDVKQILAITGKGSLLRVATGNPGAIFAPRGETVEKGTFTSAMNDASTPALYGNLDAVISVPLNAAVEFRTRTGNTPNPSDGTWSAWSDPEGRVPFKIASPPGRYTQFQVTLIPTPKSESPEIREVKMYYITANQPPRIDSLTVLPAPQVRQPTAPPQFLQQTMSPAPTAISVPAATSAARGSSPSGDQNFNVGLTAASDDITLRWAASDPDQDKLRYTLFFRQIPSDSWTLLEEKIYENEYRWKTDSLPDGRYEVKLTASDDESNSEERALTEDYLSDPFTIDHSRPTITFGELKKVAEGKYYVTGSATDQTSVISKIEYSLDNLEWKMILPDDGINDSTVETYKFSIKLANNGPHKLLIRATDAVGNIGSAAKDF